MNSRLKSFLAILVAMALLFQQGSITTILAGEAEPQQEEVVTTEEQTTEKIEDNGTAGTGNTVIEETPTIDEDEEDDSEEMDDADEGIAVQELDEVNDGVTVENVGTDSFTSSTNGSSSITYSGYSINNTKNAFLTSKWYNASCELGVAGNFHLVAFDKAYLESHTNGNILAKELDANGKNFGTNNLTNEVSYIQEYTGVHPTSASKSEHTLVIGSNNRVTNEDNGNTIGINGTKMDCPKNFIQDSNTTANPFIDLGELKETITSTSTTLANQININTTTSMTSKDHFEIKLTNPDVAGYYNMTASQLNSSPEIDLTGFQSGHKGSIIINVDCANADFVKMPDRALVYIDGKKQETDEVIKFDNGKVIWNFYNFSTDSENTDPQNQYSIQVGTMTGIVIAPGAAVTAVSNLNGTIIADYIDVKGETHRTDFTGTLNPISADIVATKMVNSSTPTADEKFDFKLESWDAEKGSWATEKTVQNNGSTISFGTLTYDYDTNKDGMTYYYRISETEGSVNGYTYDSTQYIVKIEVKAEDNSHLSKSVTYYQGKEIADAIEKNEKNVALFRNNKNTTTVTPTPEETETDTPTPTETVTGTPTPTETVTGTPTPTETVTGTPTPTVTPTTTPQPVYGSVAVTKNVTMNGEPTATNATYYTALFSDANLTTRVSDVKALSMNGQSTTTVTFDNLELGTYYVAETLEDGTVFSGSDAVEVEVTGGTCTLTSTNTTAAATITNKITTEEHNYENGSLIVTKQVMLDGEAVTLPEATFYVALFSDSEFSTLASDVKALNIENASSTTVTFTNLTPGTYYVAETDEDGVPVDNDDEDFNYIAEVSANEVTIAGGDTQNVTITNTLKPNYPNEYNYETPTPTPTAEVTATPSTTNSRATNTVLTTTVTPSSSTSTTSTTSAVKTGDDTPLALLLLLLIASAGGVLVLARKKRFH